MAGKGIGQNGINPDHPNLKARILPHNNEAEQAVLGCVLLDADAPIHILRSEEHTSELQSPA